MHLDRAATSALRFASSIAWDVTVSWRVCTRSVNWPSGCQNCHDFYNISCRVCTRSVNWPYCDCQNCQKLSKLSKLWWWPVFVVHLFKLSSPEEGCEKKSGLPPPCPVGLLSIPAHTVMLLLLFILLVLLLLLFLPVTILFDCCPFIATQFCYWFCLLLLLLGLLLLLLLLPVTYILPFFSFKTKQSARWKDRQ